MEFYTSFYTNIPFEEKEGVFRVSISGAPSLDIYRKFISSNNLDYKEIEYYIKYRQEILKEDIVLSRLEQIISMALRKNDKKIIFYCYEKPDEFCHRHILAEKISYLLMKKIPEIKTGQTRRVMGRCVGVLNF